MASVGLGVAAVFLAWGVFRFLVWVLESRPSSLGSRYRRDVAERTSGVAPRPEATEADLARLPVRVQAWLRRSGVVGRPRPSGFHVRFKGALRRAHGARWMSTSVEQHTILDPPVRLFLMRAFLFGIPFRAYHRMVGDRATMEVRVASLWDVVHADGPEMDRSEAVTFFNDLCLLAPGALLDTPVRWEDEGPEAVVAHYTHGAHTISATLTFNAEGDLVGFTSHDRLQSEDGRTFTPLPWATPVWAHRDFGGLRVAGEAEAVWLEPGGAFSYARLTVEDLQTF